MFAEKVSKMEINFTAVQGAKNMSFARVAKLIITNKDIILSLTS
jgi:hypothetical protein